MLFVGAGYRVTLFDINEEQRGKAIVDIAAQLKALKVHTIINCRASWTFFIVKESDLLTSTLSVEAQLELLSVTGELAEAIKGAFFVQEAVWEDLELKTKVFASIDKLAEDGQILASSASALQPSRFTENLARRAQCIVTHPTNPPFYCPLVEVVPSAWTRPDVVERTVALMKEIGQDPVVIKKEVYGFALNRLQYALLSEAYRLVADGVISPTDLDKVMSQGLGRRYAFMGPLETTHLNAGGVRVYNDMYGEMIHNVVADFGPNPRISDEELKNPVADAMEAEIPLDRLEERRQWRDQRLAALAKLKKEMDAKHPF